jgi:hypothetical protein
MRRSLLQQQLYVYSSNNNGGKQAIWPFSARCPWSKACTTARGVKKHAILNGYH